MARPGAPFILGSLFRSRFFSNGPMILIGAMLANAALPFAATGNTTLGTFALMLGLKNAGHELLTLTRRVLQQHPKRITAVVTALLLGGGGGAFAVASLAPDASDIPVQQIVESVQALPLQTQVDALTDHAFSLYRSEITRSSDTAESLLRRLGIDDPAAAAFLRADSNVRQALLGRAGRNIRAEASDSNALLQLTARWTADDSGQFKRLVIERAANGTFSSRVELAPLQASSRLASGTIQSSLFAATDDAGLPDSIATQMAEIFSGDIDFHRALRKGDRFSVVYEALEGDGEPLRTGRVLSAEFVNAGKTYQAMWFDNPTASGKGAYYTLDGQSLRRAFLASPMEFSRVTSGFKMRFHPVLKTMKAHLGTDYGAPTGTPVRSVGDGVVDFAGWQNGFGNVVFIKHNGNQTTVYAHLSKINVRKGQSVSQGTYVGAVGSTGMSTGPHLHFEFRVNGVHRDPLTIARQSESVPVTAQARPAFNAAAASARQQLVAAGTMRDASAQ